MYNVDVRLSLVLGEPRHRECGVTSYGSHIHMYLTCTRMYLTCTRMYLTCTRMYLTCTCST